MFNLKLKEYRLKSELSQREIAKLLDITQPCYWKWEKGKSFPNAKQIMQLCDVLNCTPNDIFGIPGVLTVAYQNVYENKKKKAK